MAGELLTTVGQGSLVYGSRERPRAVREVPDDGEGTLSSRADPDLKGAQGEGILSSRADPDLRGMSGGRGELSVRD